MRKLNSIFLAVPLLIASALPASADVHHRYRHHYVRHTYATQQPYHGHGVGPGRGALIGGAGGAVLGGALGGGKGALIGGALGAGTGAVVGKTHQDHMRRDYYNGQPR